MTIRIPDWLKMHPLINIHALERAAELPAGTLKFALSGSRSLPEKYLPALEDVLKEYGFPVPEN